MKKPIRPLGGRWYGLQNLEVVVEQSYLLELRIRSIHISRRAARQRAAVLRQSCSNPVAALSLYGNPTQKYHQGDILDPKDIHWREWRPADHCSECCDNCRPDSLTYRCPITKDNPLCDTVMAALTGGTQP